MDLGWCSEPLLSLAWPHHQNQLGVTISVPPSIIATPGRLVHVAVEMNLKLQSVEYVVFDEADRSVRSERARVATRCPWLATERCSRLCDVPHPFPTGSLRWALRSSSRRSSHGSQAATRPSSSPPRCPSCSSSSPGLVRSVGQVAARGLGVGAASKAL